MSAACGWLAGACTKSGRGQTGNDEVIAKSKRVEEDGEERDGWKSLEEGH